jgi:hypothetical protein
VSDEEDRPQLLMVDDKLEAIGSAGLTKNGTQGTEIFGKKKTLHK